jgi:hypothetical protein
MHFCQRKTCQKHRGKGKTNNPCKVNGLCDLQHDYYCNGYLQAFFLLTAKAIESGKHYKLYSVQDDEGNTKYIDSSKYESLM